MPNFPDLNFAQPWTELLKDAVWEREFGRFLDENFPRDKFNQFRTFLDEGSGNLFPAWDAYKFVRDAREALRMIAGQQNQRSLFNLTNHFPWHLVGGWKLDRIRICENCSRVFFADRRNKLTCSDTCSTTRRVREWRKHQGQYEHARKLKSVKGTHVAGKQDSKGGKNVTRKTR